ncbi:MAG TPA: cupredoxin domain-containing protein [Candidatus Limnocylindrales bacterium]|nr:cupredoxin domain-containing protein [Candidatus Limnocylindrales bacterium]
MRPNIARPLAALALLGLLLAVAGCGGSASPPPTYPPGAIVVTAENRRFDTSELVVPADTVFPLVLVNKDGDPHNIAIRTKGGFDGELIFRHDPIAASTIVLQVGPIPAGTYHFICEVHPEMNGTVLAQ